MTSPSSAIRFAFLIAVPVLLAAAAMLPAVVPVAVKPILPALVAGAIGFAAWRSHARNEADAAKIVAERDSALADAAKASALLRHDLRGMLSPALLNADRLSTNTDPVARRAAEAMIVAIERMEQRLRDH